MFRHCVMFKFKPETTDAQKAQILVEVGQGRREGERLDDIQYLVNRILRRHVPNAARIKVDCAHFRSIQEDQLRAEIQSVAERVKSTGKPFQMRPLNAYYRRMVHNILADESQISSHSPSGDDRLKRIMITSKKSPKSSS